MTIGTALWARAASGGAQAIGQPVGAIEAGKRADLVVLDADDVGLAEQAPEDVLDAAIFGPARAPVRDVMAGGRWIVEQGHHLHEAAVFARYRDALMRIDGA